MTSEIIIHSSHAQRFSDMAPMGKSFFKLNGCVLNTSCFKKCAGLVRHIWDSHIFYTSFVEIYIYW